MHTLSITGIVSKMTTPPSFKESAHSGIFPFSNRCWALAMGLGLCQGVYVVWNRETHRKGNAPTNLYDIDRLPSKQKNMCCFPETKKQVQM